MGIRQTRILPARLEGVRQRFERWRETHRARSPLPDELWAAAVKLVGRYGLNRTARALHLDYYSLQKRVERGSNVARRTSRRSAAVTFLELPPPAGQGRPSGRDVGVMPASACNCALELEDAAGSKMRVHLQGAEAPDLAALSRSFWDRGL